MKTPRSVIDPFEWMIPATNCNDYGYDDSRYAKIDSAPVITEEVFYKENGGEVDFLDNAYTSIYELK